MPTIARLYREAEVEDDGSEVVAAPLGYKLLDSLVSWAAPLRCDGRPALVRLEQNDLLAGVKLIEWYRWRREWTAATMRSR